VHLEVSCAVGWDVGDLDPDQAGTGRVPRFDEVVQRRRPAKAEEPDVFAIGAVYVGVVEVLKDVA
jgi:hypothetical protein